MPLEKELLHVSVNNLRSIIPMKTPVLKIDHMEVVYHGAIRALRGFDLQVNEDQIACANGFGTSTTLKAIA